MYCKKCNNKLKPHFKYCNRCMEPTGFVTNNNIINENKNNTKIYELIYIIITILSFIYSCINTGVFKFLFYIFCIITIIIGKKKYSNNGKILLLFWFLVIYSIYLFIRYILPILVIIFFGWLIALY